MTDCHPDQIRIPEAEAPFRIYFFADTHLQAFSPGDPLLPDAWKQSPSPDLGRTSEELLQSHLNRAVEAGADLVLHGGDLFHFPSPENAALANRLFRQCPLPVWSIPGNHDWFYPGQDGWEELRDRQLPLIRPPIEPTPWSRVWNGVRMVGIDSSTYFLDEADINAVQEALRGKEPVLLLMHIPPSTPELRTPVIDKHGSPLLIRDPESRTREAIDPAPTWNLIDALREAPALKGILAAHVHLSFSGEFAPGIPLLIPEAGYRNGYRIVDVVNSGGPQEIPS